MDRFWDRGRHDGAPQRPVPVIRVLIVDDHPVLRRGLKASLLYYADLEIVGEAGTGEEALRLLEQVQPDIVLMDLLMPGMGGVAAIRAIRMLDPQVKIIVLATDEDGDQVQEALQTGAIGYHLKGVDIDELVMAIRQAVRGIAPSHRTSAAAQELVRNTNNALALGDELTDREREVLALLAKGLSTAKIAEQMMVTVATVQFDLRSIRRKLGAKFWKELGD